MLAVRECAESFMRELKVLEAGLDSVRTLEQADRFARALALYEMAYLPTRPQTCPFCLEYADDRCGECGYARTHGGICNDDRSAFVAFVEALNSLGAAVKAIPDPAVFVSLKDFDVEKTNHIAKKSIDDAREATLHLIKYLTCVDDETIGETADNLTHCAKDISMQSNGFVEVPGTFWLMEQKAMYLRRMIRILPLEAIYSQEAVKLREEVLLRLERYW